MQLTENFSLEEFACNDANKTPVPNEYLNNCIIVADNLQELRDFLNGGFGVYEYIIKITSAYRTPEHNKKEGGSTKSQHLTASASDIKVFRRLKKSKGNYEQVPPDTIADLIDLLIEFGYMDIGGVGRYNTFTHYDIRGKKVNFDFRTDA